MRPLKYVLGATAAVVLAGTVATSSAIAAESIYMGALVYRTGAYAPGGIPFSNAFRDYVTLLNERDGGIGGVKIEYEECEFQYNTKLGVECYEKLKGKRPVAVIPNSTGLTYQLIPKSVVDEIPIVTMGYGRTSSAIGSVFPWVFNFPATYWSQATAVIQYIGNQEGGLDKLKGKKIVHIYHNSAYGKEANPILKVLEKKFGFKLTLLAVDHPGQEQKATWLQIRRKKPDWIFLSGWGVMNSVAIKSASEIGFPMDHFIGNWWSGAKPDVLPAGMGAHGYKAATFHRPGGGQPLHAEIKKHVYDKGKGAFKKEDFHRTGEIVYLRGMLNYIVLTEAVRNAQKKFGVKVPIKEQIRWGFENLKLDKAAWKRIGLEGFPELSVSCNDHENAKGVLFQQWDAKAQKWNLITDWIPVMRDIVRPLQEADAAKFAKANNITPRKCS